MSARHNYFKHRLASLDSNRQNLSKREIETIQILEKVTGENFYSSSKSILDLGCGDKFLKPIIESHSKKYTGLDIEDIDFDASRFLFDIENIDLFLAYSLIEHLSNPSYLLEAVKSCVSSNAKYFLVECPNWKYSFKDFYNDPTHIKPYTPESLSNLFESFGFQTVGLFPNLRCKPTYFYKSKYRFEIAARLPFLGSSSPFIPDLFKGRARGIFGIFKLQK